MIVGGEENEVAVSSEGDVREFLSACIAGGERLQRFAYARPAVWQQEVDGSCPLHWLVIEDYCEAALRLLDFGCPVDLRDALGRTALGLACLCGRLGCARALLDKGAEPDTWEDFLQQPVLDVAIRSKHLDLMTLLLERGASWSYLTPAHDTVYRSLAHWEPDARALAASVLERFGCSRAKVFEQLRLGEIYETMEDAFHW